MRPPHKKTLKEWMWNNNHEKWLQGLHQRRVEVYKNVPNIINELGWKDLSDKRRDTCLMMFYKIITHEVNVPSEGKLSIFYLLLKGETRPSQAQYMHIGSDIDEYKTHKPSKNGTNFQALLSTLQVLRPLRIGWRPCPYQSMNATIYSPYISIFTPAYSLLL